LATYDIVISFAGEDRPVAEEIARGLVLKGMHVFYDEYARAELWGKDLYSHLTTTYRDEGKFCLMIISENYAKKLWTSHERRAAQARAFADSSEYILPLRLDDTSVDGVLTTTGYIDMRSTALERVVELLVQKVAAYDEAHGVVHGLVPAERVFALQNLQPKGSRPFMDSDMVTTCPTCEAGQTLGEAPQTLDEFDTVYTCKNGCQPIVVVGRPGLSAWPGRGYRIGDYVIRNARDLFVETEAMAGPVLIPASKAALMKLKPEDPLSANDG
jgi:hypothetical protein